MNKEDESDLLHWLQDKDVSEVMDLLMKHGNRYSRRILKFFCWFCKYVPVILMCFHAYGMWDFSQHPREMFITNNENFPCYLFIYFMVYILPMVLILASRFFFLCWRYRIPFFYFFGINAAIGQLHTKDVAKDYWHEVKNDKINIADWCVLWGEMVNRNDEKIRKWFPKIGTLDYERKIFDECVSFLANGELPFYDLKV